MIFLSEQIVLTDAPVPALDTAYTAWQRASDHIVPDRGVRPNPIGCKALAPEIGFSDDCTHSIRTGRAEAERFIDEFLAQIARDK